MVAVHAFSFLGERLAPMLQNRTTALTCCWENSGLALICEGDQFTGALVVIPNRFSGEESVFASAVCYATGLVTRRTCTVMLSGPSRSFAVSLIATQLCLSLCS